MRFLLISILLFDIVALTISQSPTNASTLFKFSEDCAKQQNVSSQHAYEVVFSGNSTPIDYKIKCFLHCAMEESIAFRKYWNLTANKIDHGLSIKHEDECEQGLKKFECYYKRTDK
ncbi:general odorant-binding protein 56d-like [Drosophila biarmipes]|uniref:general odorant-binding protein 56d-like n=1 Tax=Drosophila biarmipes TaxID=125945 RepID=UPI0007E8AB46|nr:general odorant-binding protein 56d-like [Drosophila biarmipes]XP_050743383.1 general odorant-binding protein 56d-like [Drosophila biarmipes]XP_050743384.1 general odorant-binding protein 56d-like [Drosophila biarmipes]XP_050743385.1 general odorant-binding protein 56d-like [Drosophila biarmipes]